jgi:hypothetical protein
MNCRYKHVCNKASDTAPLIKIIYDIKSVANIGCLCDATFAKLQKASVHDSIFSIFLTFKNFAKVASQRHPMLATDLISYMILIRGAVSDALFDGYTIMISNSD